MQISPAAGSIFDANLHARTGGVSLRLGRIIESVNAPSPTPTVGGQWAYIYFEMERAGQSYQVLALIGTVPLGGNWGHYWSSVAAPAHLFKSRLPTLMKIWQSYYVSDKTVAKRMEDALLNMQEAGRIYREGLAGASKGADFAAEPWKQVIRDQTVVEAPDGWRYDTQLTTVDDFLLAHPEFRRVPVEELVQGR